MKFTSFKGYLYPIFYSYFKKEQNVLESHERLLRLDYNANCFRNLLSKCKKFLTKGEAKELRKYTINLDINLMKSISLTRDKIDQSTTETGDDEENNDKSDVNGRHVNNQETLKKANDEDKPSNSSNTPPRSPRHQNDIKELN